MKEVNNEFLLDTDVIFEHLKSNDEISTFEKYLSKGVCYTSIINAVEIYSLLKNKKELADSLLYSLKVLGLPARYSMEVVKFEENYSVRDVLFIITAKMNKLPIVSFNEEKYISSGVRIINPKNL